MKSIIREMLKTGCSVMFFVFDCSIFRKNVIANYCRPRITLLFTENTVKREQLILKFVMLLKTHRIKDTD